MRPPSDPPEPSLTSSPVPAASPAPEPPSLWPATDHAGLAELRSTDATIRQAALVRLLAMYEEPVVRAIRAKWPALPWADVEEIASEFQVRCLVGAKAHFLTFNPQAATRVSGPPRLRTYLSTILDNLLAGRHRRETALKRGGPKPHAPPPDPAPDAGLSSAGEPSSDPHSLIFDRLWAHRVLAQAYARVETGAPQTVVLRVALRPWILAAEDEETSLLEVARSLGRTHNSVRVELSRLRKAWRAALRGIVLATLTDPADIEDELRHLAAVLGHFPTPPEGEDSPAALR